MAVFETNSSSEENQLLGIKIEYHKADIAIREFLEKCGNSDYYEKQPSFLLFVAAIAFVIAGELALVFYFLGESLGTSSALYAAITAIVFIFCSSFGVAFSHANTSRNLPLWRRLIGICGMLASLCVFLYGLGILSGWRSDTVSMGFQSVISGYGSMADVPVFATALVNFFGFALLTYETRTYLWAKYWGYRELVERYDKAKASFVSLNMAEADENE